VGNGLGNGATPYAETDCDDRAMTNRRLTSEKVLLSVPMSYAGSRARIWQLTRLSEQRVLRIVLVVVAALLIGVAWVLVSEWYVGLTVAAGVAAGVARLTTRARRLPASRREYVRQHFAVRGLVAVRNGRIRYRLRRYPVAGARAQVDSSGSLDR
jgi:hypothetical protein